MRKLYKDCCKYHAVMVHDNTYSERLICSKRIKNYINKECKQKFIEEYPETEGSKITENQILTYLIKSKLGLFYLENGEQNP